MKRNVVKLFKYVMLMGITMMVTIVLYRLIRGSTGELSGIPEQAKLRHFDSFMDNEKIDWHDYKQIIDDLQRKGVGEQGAPAKLSESEQSLYDSIFKVNGFNGALSDKIALDRSLPDIRHEGCKKKMYLKHLGSVSIIVPFHNEHWTTLLRTVTSVLNRSPANLIKEIILVDDYSSKDFLKSKLDAYVAEHMPKVSIIHLPERSGLIRARLAGARAATGEILIFLDSHTEANVNWLPPLLEPIAQNYRTCVCPFIDVIQYDSFEYRAQDSGARGAFDWEFYYKRLPLLPDDLKHPTEPFKSPIMAGGLFAISAKFFWELEGYDEGLDIWGGEQYELSFKIWMCGGEMVDAPCSRVGHIYRKYAPFKNPGVGDFVSRNYKRVAIVWMDEYAEYLYKRKPNMRNMDPGDVSKQVALRNRLQCKTFKWFMETIAFDLPRKYPMIEPEDFAFGEIRNIGAPEFCVDTNFKSRDSVVELRNCIKGTSNRGEQNFTLTWHKDIRPKGKTLCLDVSASKNKADITLYPCHGGKGNQMWRYNIDKQWLMHGTNQRCMDCDPGSQRVYVSDCDNESKTQRWRIENVNLTMLANWDSVGPA